MAQHFLVFIVLTILLVLPPCQSRSLHQSSGENLSESETTSRIITYYFLRDECLNGEFLDRAAEDSDIFGSLIPKNPSSFQCQEASNGISNNDEPFYSEKDSSSLIERLDGLTSFSLEVWIQSEMLDEEISTIFSIESEDGYSHSLKVSFK